MNLYHATVRLRNREKSIDFTEAERIFCSLLLDVFSSHPEVTATVYPAKQFCCSASGLLQFSVFVVTFQNAGLAQVDSLLSNFIIALRVPKENLVLYPEKTALIEV